MTNIIRDKESVVIRQEIDRTNSTYYVVVDQAKDVTQVKVAINNPIQLKVVLMHIAWFKYVKKLKKTKLMTNLEYTCSATSGEFLIVGLQRIPLFSIWIFGCLNE